MNKPTKFLVCRKVLPNLLEHVTKRAGPDILALQAQTAARTCGSELGVPVEFEAYNFT